MEKNKICVALDADVLRRVSVYYYYITKNPTGDFSDCLEFQHLSTFAKEKQLEETRILHEMLISKKISVFIGNTVYHQVIHKKECMKYLKKIDTYFPNMKTENFSEITFKTDELAYSYTKDEFKVNERTYHPPMNISYNAFLRRYIPCEDAYVMAEATVVGCTLITLNGKDFVYDNSVELHNMRTVGIIDINKRKGFVQEKMARY